MAYRRCISIRRNIVDRTFQPSLSYVFHSDERKRECPEEKTSLANIGHFLQRRSFSGSINGSTGFAASSHTSFMPSSGYSFCRYMSTALNQGSDKIGVMSDVAEVLTDTTLDGAASQLPFVSEVAIAAADSYLPVKALQYFIDGVHSFTGLEWWAAIAITTILIRAAAVPLMIHQLKSTSKLSLIKPKMDAIRQEIEEKGLPFTEGQRRMTKLFTEHGVNPFTPLMGIFIQGPIFISFFFAITNMTEKMESFKHGGAYWFIDLTTPDDLYILPVLTALTFWVTVELNLQQGMEGNPSAGTIKNMSRGLAVLTVPFTWGFPKAIFCYWITANLFSLVYGFVLRIPGLKQKLGIPDVPIEEPTNAPKPAFPIFPALKNIMSASSKPSSLPVEPSRLQGKKTSSDISQRLRTLEKQVKGKKKNKKR